MALVVEGLRHLVEVLVGLRVPVPEGGACAKGRRFGEGRGGPGAGV